MNNSLIDIITGKERKRYNQIIQLIEQKNYSVLFDSELIEGIRSYSKQDFIDTCIYHVDRDSFSGLELILI